MATQQYGSNRTHDAWVHKYYDEFVPVAQKFGIDVPDFKAFYDKISPDNIHGSYITNILKPIYGQLATKYNDIAKQYADATGGEFRPMATSVGSFDPNMLETLFGQIGQMQSQLGYEQGKPKAEEPTLLDLRNELRNDPQFKLIEDAINKSLGKGEPTFGPESITKWQSVLSEAARPFIAEGQNNLNEQFNFLNPYGFGSGNQARAVSEFGNKFQQNLFDKATGLAKSNYDTDTANYWNAIGKKTGLESFITDMAKATKDTNWQQKFNELQQSWQQYFPYQQRQWDLEDTASQKDWARQLADMLKTEYNPMDDIVKGTTAAANIGKLISSFMSPAKI